LPASPDDFALIGEVVIGCWLLLLFFFFGIWINVHMENHFKITSGAVAPSSIILHNVKREHPLPPTPKSGQTPPADCLAASCSLSSFPLGASRTISYDVFYPLVYIVDDDWESKRWHKKLFWRFGYQEKPLRKLRKTVQKHNPSQLKPIHPYRSFAARCSRLLRIPLIRIIWTDLMDTILKRSLCPYSK
jgi:hypothetical protein